MTDQHAQSKPPWFAAAIVVPLVLALALATLPGRTPPLEPRDLPLGIAGRPRRPRRLRSLNEQGGFELHRYADARAANEAIENREVYGAIAVGAEGTTLLVSSAASPLVAGSLEHAFASGTGPMAAERTVDVVPADPDDPRGGVLSLWCCRSCSPASSSGRSSRLGSSRLKQTGALLAAATFAGIVATAMVQSWLGALEARGW